MRGDRAPDVSHFRVFGFIAYAHVPETERRKLDKKVTKLIFLEYSNRQKDYRLFNVEKRKTVIKRDVIFNETDFRHEKQTVKMKSEEEVEADNDPEVCYCQHLRRSQRATKAQPATRFGFDEYADHTDVTKVTHMALRAAILDTVESNCRYRISGTHGERNVGACQTTTQPKSHRVQVGLRSKV